MIRVTVEWVSGLEGYFHVLKVIFIATIWCVCV